MILCLFGWEGWLTPLSRFESRSPPYCGSYCGFEPDTRCQRGLSLSLWFLSPNPALDCRPSPVQTLSRQIAPSEPEIFPEFDCRVLFSCPEITQYQWSPLYIQTRSAPRPLRKLLPRNPSDRRLVVVSPCCLLPIPRISRRPASTNIPHTGRMYSTGPIASRLYR